MDRHVTDGEINEWISRDELPTSSHDHLRECRLCRGRYEHFLTLQKKIDHLRDSRREPVLDLGPCPSVQVWARVAAGSLFGNEASPLITHAAKCSDCAELLEAALADVEEELSGGAEAHHLAAPDREIIERYAAQLQISAHPPRTTWRRPTVYIIGGIAAAVIVVIGITLFVRAGPWRADRLLAQAFTERRTIAMRFPGAAYSPLRQQRSAEGSEEPRPLIEAELAISSSPPHESNAKWLEIEGRVAFLRWDFDKAINAFERAQSLSNSDRLLQTALMADLGMAYFERGEAETRGVDYSASAEQLSKAIALLPSSSLLRFNRAIAYERLYLYSQAFEDWKDAIRLEPNGGWAEEARSHLAAIEEKRRSEINLYTPRAYLDRRADLGPEFELRPATESWMGLIGEGEPEALEAVTALARDLQTSHRDPWLKDLTAALNHPLGRRSYLALSQAAQANATGQTASAERSAHEAASLFRSIGNRAGSLFSEFEQALAQQRALRRADCAGTTGKLIRTIPDSYRWLRAQVWIERGVCKYHTGDLGESWRDLSSALEIAREAGYSEAAHRAASYQNDYRAELGDANGAWESNLAGLSETWSGPHEPKSRVP
jgi:hypothetical protein